MPVQTNQRKKNTNALNASFRRTQLASINIADEASNIVNMARQTSEATNVHFLNALRELTTSFEQKQQELMKDFRKVTDELAAIKPAAPAPSPVPAPVTPIPEVWPEPQTSAPIEAPRSSALDELANLVATEVIPAVKKRPGEPNYLLSEMTSALVIQSPLAAIEAAIIHHIELYRMLPDSIYVSTETYKALAEQHQRVKFADFTGVYHYFANKRNSPISIKTERDFPRWWLGINRDQVYCAAF